ncbi:MAG TPA: GAF domain-containing protein, partial [Burkholderiales bacterium]|nr:GAF domain-containing protein [Burkholderiales bacterium]
MAGSLHDLSQHERSDQRLWMQYAITRILGESCALDQAAPELLEAIGEGMEWDWGALWTVDPEARVLRCGKSIWHAPNMEVAEFDAISREMTFTPGQGLLGRVWQSAEPAWVVDVTRDANFLRADVAAKVGLRGAIAFPILLGGETLAVMEFFSRAVREPDRQQLAQLATVASQIAQCIERKRAEAARRESEQRWRAAFQNSPVGIGIAHLGGRLLEANPALRAMLGYTKEELRSLTFIDFTYEEDVELTNAKVA